MLDPMKFVSGLRKPEERRIPRGAYLVSFTVVTIIVATVSGLPDGRPFSYLKVGLIAGVMLFALWFNSPLWAAGSTGRLKQRGSDFLLVVGAIVGGFIAGALLGRAISMIFQA